MTLKQKRRVIRWFKAGNTVHQIYWSRLEPDERPDYMTRIEQALRDYMNGKFELRPKKKAKR